MKDPTSKKTDLLSRKSFAKRERFCAKSWCMEPSISLIVRGAFCEVVEVGGDGG